jgi:hypothetical protein
MTFFLIRNALWKCFIVPVRSWCAEGAVFF